MYIKVCCVCVKKWHRAPFSIKNRSQAITYAPMSLPVPPSEITALGLTGRGPRSANPTCYLGKEMMQRVDRLGDTTCCIRSTWLRTPKVMTYQKFQGHLYIQKSLCRPVHLGTPGTSPIILTRSPSWEPSTRDSSFPWEWYCRATYTKWWARTVVGASRGTKSNLDGRSTLA